MEINVGSHYGLTQGGHNNDISRCHSDHRAVGMNYRYTSAWNEVNARIAKRQNAVTIFVSLSTAIITVLVTSARWDTPINTNIFSLLLPVVSLAFGLLNYKRDMTIALLRDFLADCETFTQESYALQLNWLQ
jgi:hypothetical protein